LVSLAAEIALTVCVGVLLGFTWSLVTVCCLLRLLINSVEHRTWNSCWRHSLMLPLVCNTLNY